MPVTKIRTGWSSGNLQFKDNDGNIIAEWNSDARKLSFPSGSTLEVLGDLVAAGEIDATDIVDGGVTGKKLGLAVQNATGLSIAADTLVAVVKGQVAAGLPLIVLADADAAGHDDIWVTTAAIANGAAGVVVKSALSAATLNTNGVTTAGDPVYLGTTAGGFSNTAPTGSDDRVHPVGIAMVKSATVGQILWYIGPVRKIATNDYQALSVDAAALAAGAVETAKIATGALSADAPGRALVAADFFGDTATVDDKFAAGTIGEDLLTANEVTGRAVANVANANVIGGIPILFRINTSGAGAQDIDVLMTHKVRVIDAWVVNGGAGGAADTIQIKNVVTAITDAMDCNKADQTVTRAGTIDDAQHEIAAAANLRVSVVDADSSLEASVVYVLAIRVA